MFAVVCWGVSVMCVVAEVVCLCIVVFGCVVLLLCGVVLCGLCCSRVC